MNTKTFTLFLLFSFWGYSIFAQQPGAMAGPRGGSGGAMGQSGRLYGKVVDAGSGKGIAAATLQLTASRYNPALGKMVDTMLTGQLTPNNGNFSLENIPVIGEYTLSISAIGYKAYQTKVGFLTKEQQEKLTKAMKEMGAQQKAASMDTANKGKKKRTKPTAKYDGST